jgi:hypothetical protein
MLTLVTEFFDLPSREKNSRRRDASKYYESARRLLALDIPMIIYTEHPHAEKIIDIRREYGHQDITEVVVAGLEYYRYWKYLPQITHQFTSGTMKDFAAGWPDKYTPLYIVCVSTKFSCMEDACNRNPFKTKNIAWIDFGIFHHRSVTPDLGQILRLRDGLLVERPNKITVFRLKTILDGNKYTVFRTGINAAIWSASISDMQWFVQEYHQEFDNCIKIGYASLEEHIMPIIVDWSPDRFYEIYGYYDTAMDNLLTYQRGFEYILNMTTRLYRHHKRYEDGVRSSERLWSSRWRMSPTDLVAYLDEYAMALYYTKGDSIRFRECSQELRAQLITNTISTSASEWKTPNLKWYPTEPLINSKVKLVTCLYNIAKIENNRDRKNVDEYINYAKYILGLPFHIIIYTEEENIEPLRKIREDLGLLSYTTFISSRLQDSKYYPWKIKLMTTQHKMNRSIPKKFTNIYYIMTWNKFICLENTIKQFGTDFTYTWIDIGVYHTIDENPNVANISHLIMGLSKEQEKITVCRRWYHHNSTISYCAGIIAGSSEDMLWLCKEIDNHIMTSDEYYLEEGLMSRIFEAHPERCNEYYGDYRHVTTNLYQPYQGFNWIIKSVLQLARKNDNFAYGVKVGDWLYEGRHEMLESDLALFLDEYLLCIHYNKPVDEEKMKIVKAAASVVVKVELNESLKRNLKYY